TSHADFLLDGAEPEFRYQFLASLGAQTRHLYRAWDLASPGTGTIAALAGLMAADAALDGGRRGLRLPARIEAELADLVLDDGCLANRNPSAQLGVLRDLIWLLAARRAANAPVPLAVHGAIERMAPVLGAFRHGDGGLALFHGASEE